MSVGNYVGFGISLQIVAYKKLKTGLCTNGTIAISLSDSLLRIAVLLLCNSTKRRNNLVGSFWFDGLPRQNQVV